jgi:hypothetical protein
VIFVPIVDRFNVHLSSRLCNIVTTVTISSAGTIAHGAVYFLDPEWCIVGVTLFNPAPAVVLAARALLCHERSQRRVDPLSNLRKTLFVGHAPELIGCAVPNAEVSDLRDANVPVSPMMSSLVFASAADGVSGDGATVDASIESLDGNNDSDDSETPVDVTENEDNTGREPEKSLMV